MVLKLDGNLISAVIAFILSFCVERIPKFKDWWANFQSKEITIAGAAVVVTAVMVGLSYAGAPIEGVPQPFIWDGLFSVLGMLVSFLVASQTAYMLQAGKLERKQ